MVSLTTQNITLTTWQDAFNQHLCQTYSASATIRTAQQHINVFEKWYQAQFDQEFQPTSITNYALRLYQKHSLEIARVSPNTWNSRLWALTILTSWIETQNGASYSNLLVGLKNKEQGIRPSKYRSLSDKEIHDLMQQIERNIRGSVTAFEHQTNKRDSALITIMVRAGLRVAEVAALDHTDLTINERSGSVRVRNGKGNKERIIPLNNEARTALNELIGNTSAAALFSGKNSARLTTRHIERIVSYIGSQIGIPDMSPHWLRFTFAKALERKGIAIEMIRDLLGHNSIETTRRYLRSSFDDLQAAVEI